MPRSDDYKAAIALAVAELKNLNPKRLENRTGAQHFVEEAQEGLIVPYFGQARRITWPEVGVTPGNGQGEISLPEQILILHYLLNASGEPLTGRTIDFRQVPEGGFYWSAFVSRAKKPLLETFGHDLDLFGNHSMPRMTHTICDSCRGALRLELDQESGEKLNSG